MSKNHPSSLRADLCGKLSCVCLLPCLWQVERLHGQVPTPDTLNIYFLPNVRAHWSYMVHLKIRCSRENNTICDT